MTQGYQGDWPDSLPEDTLLLPVADSPSFEADPQGFMACALLRAKWWIMNTEDMKAIYAAWVTQSNYTMVLSRPGLSRTFAHQASGEMERLLERRLGILIERGISEGTIYSKAHLHAPAVYTAVGSQRNKITKVQQYWKAMGEASIEDFEAAIELAREEGVVSRAAVIRFLTGEDRRSEERSNWNAGKRRHDSNRMIQALADDMLSATAGIELIEASDLDVLTKLECMESIRGSIRKIQGRMKLWAQTK